MAASFHDRLPPLDTVIVVGVVEASMVSESVPDSCHCGSSSGVSSRASISASRLGSSSTAAPLP